MRLISLRLQNFRQHADTRLQFERGLTGIIGPNGAGKSTILEAIAWSLYGNAAARGTRDSIRFSRAKDRSPVRVELEFELAAHRYRVVRGLTSAECYLDGGDAPIANSITAVTELLQRRLGMTRSEFFHTYFTGQKELDVMAALGPLDRARFLSRVLGYDRIASAQELVRERRRALVAEVNGLRQGMADGEQVARALRDAEARLAAARKRLASAEVAFERAKEKLEQVTPQWLDAQAEKERAQLLDSEIKIAEADALSYAREVDRLEREIAAIGVAQRELTPLTAALVPLPRLRSELEALDTLASAESKRQTLLERERALVEEQVRLEERATKLRAAPELERETVDQLSALRRSLSELDQQLEEQRTAWVRDRQEAETRLDTLRTQYADFATQRDTLEGLGAESPCPTCGRPLGASWKGVLELLSEQIETTRIDGNYYRARVEQLAKTPEAIVALEEQRRAFTPKIADAERRLARIQAGITELATINDQVAKSTRRLVEVRDSLEMLPQGYDVARHESLRAEVASLAEIERRAARLSGQLLRADAAAKERDRAVASHAAAQQRIETARASRAGIKLTDKAYLKLRTTHEQATAAMRVAELESVTAAGELKRARGDVDAATVAQQELQRLQQRLQALELDRRMHDELDRAFSDLRTDLNFQLRPELSEIASRFLESLTDGRYASIEFDEDYNLLVIEDGVPKPVISGGEEDLCNLVLRLAISQMIAERAGQSFSLLVLDEVFGSLDDVRRGNVMELLRRLNDRFEQVIVITHIEQVRDGLDRVLQVSFNEECGMSNVTAGRASTTPGEEEHEMESDDMQLALTA